MLTQSNLIPLTPSCLSTAPYQSLAEIVEYGTGEQCRATLDTILEDLGEHDGVEQLVADNIDLKEQVETLEDELKDMKAEREYELERKDQFWSLAVDAIALIEQWATTEGKEHPDVADLVARLNKLDGG